MSSPQMVDIFLKAGYQVLYAGERDRKFTIANVFVVALSPFVVVAHHADTIHNIGQTVFIQMLATENGRVNLQDADDGESVIRNLNPSVHQLNSRHNLPLLVDVNHNISNVMMKVITSQKNPLPDTAARRYAFPAGVNPLAGFSSLNTRADNRDHSVTRSFFVRKMPCCVRIMVGRNGEAFAPAGFVSAGLLTLLRLTTPFSSGLVRLINLLTRPPLWSLPLPRHTRDSSGLSLPFAATARPLPQQSITLPPPANVKLVVCPLRGRIMNKPIPAGADLFHLAGECAALVCGLMEYHSRTEHRAMCKSLVTSLEALTAAYHADTALPLPDNTASDLSEYWPDESLTLEYCLTQAKALVADTLPRDMIQPLTGLLHDLVNMLADQVKSTTPHRCQGVVLLPFVRRYPAYIEATLDPFVLALYRERREMLCRFKQALDVAGVAYVEADHA